MGKCCLHANSIIFDRIIIKFAGNQVRHNSADEFDFEPDQTTHFGVTCPWMTKIFYIFALEYQSGRLANLDQILCVASLWVGKAAKCFEADWIKTLVSMAIESPHWFMMGKMVSPSFSQLLLIRSVSYLQVTRTCIKSRTSSNFCQIGSLTTELAALERLKNFP